MSINHFSSDLPETVWWSQPQYHHHQHHQHNMETPTKSGSGTTTASTTFWGNSPLHHHHHRAAAAAASSGGLSSFNFDLNNEDEEETVERRDQEIPKEAMFEKALTPSDVGKLNRLVIPKQHAEKYFPLNAAGGNETGPEKGLLLSFEDELGKPWRFRYSYWNSSQSYVLTKGWSRFVKEKKLDAGDIVVFERHRLDGDRMFIGWRRRISALPTALDSGAGGQPAAAVGGGGWTRVYFNTSGHNNPYPDQQAHHNHHPRHGSGFPYQSDHYLHAGAGVGVGGGVLQHKPTGGGANSKRLRLFGVTMECHQDSSEEVVDSDHHQHNHHRLSTTPPEGSSTSSSHGQQEASYYPFQYYSPKAAYFNHQNHMNINFSRDANETRQEGRM